MVKKLLAASSLVVPMLLPVGCSDQDLANQEQDNSSDLKREWNRANDPVRMGYDYITSRYSYSNKLSDLPRSGSLKTEPWSGDYWPTYKGGITYRWSDSSLSGKEKYAYDLENASDLTEDEITRLSPAEKFDLLLGRTDWLVTNYERRRTNILKTVDGSSEFDSAYKIPTWEGLCHAWAPATLVYNNPKPVTMKSPDGKNIQFGSSDIKALMTYFIHSNDSQTHFLGGRCNVDFAELKKKLGRGEITPEKYKEQLNRQECRDTNAGAFHIVLTNQIGLMNEGFVADVTKDAEVWNQAVHSYSTTYSNRQGVSQGAAPGTVRELDVVTQMTYTVEIDHSWDKISIPQQNRTVTYRYRIELDAYDRIIGGEWAPSNIKDDRPDFLWKQAKPEYTGIWKTLEPLFEKSQQAGSGSVSNPGSTDEPSVGDPSGQDNGGSEHAQLTADLDWKVRGLRWGPVARVRVKGRIANKNLEYAEVSGLTFDGRWETLKKFEVDPDEYFRVRFRVDTRRYKGVSVDGYDRQGNFIGESFHSLSR